MSTGSMRGANKTPPIFSFNLIRLNFHLLVTFNSSINFSRLSVTASNFSVGNPFLCSSINFVTTLKSAGLPLNISVASMAIFCAVSLSDNILTISFAIASLGSVVSLISSILL